MKQRIIEVSSDGRYLHADRGFLVIKKGAEEVGRIPIDDVGALIGSGHGLVFSGELLVRLADRGSPLVVCDAQKRARALLLSLDGHHAQGERLRQQAHAKVGTHNRLWKQLVQAKLRAQAATLDAFSLPGESLRRLALKVRAGDPSNLEAQGARQYWSALFGKAFRRNPDLGGINALLNYGYTVLRSAAARAVVGAGLHPTLGLHHGNAFNACALADDVMEPFRPIIDAVVKGCCEEDAAAELSPATKRLLALALYRDVASEAGMTPMTTMLARLCQSLVDVYAGHRRSLELPGLPTSEALRAMSRDPGGIQESR
jgi:CRISPR-associated protein Cas1